MKVRQLRCKHCDQPIVISSEDVFIHPEIVRAYGDILGYFVSCNIFYVGVQNLQATPEWVDYEIEKP